MADTGIYYDAALIAKFYLNEPGRERVRETAQLASQVFSSAMAAIEIAAALHRNLRERRVDDETFGLLQQQVVSDFKSGVCASAAGY